MNNGERLLMHVCCGPCLTYPLRDLQGRKVAVEGIFFNPNIHPYREYRLRLTAAQLYAEMHHFPLTVMGEYGLQSFLREAVGRESTRCEGCYDTRLEAVAKAAAEKGYQAFTTTLLASPYQKHDLIRDLAQKAAARHRVEFFYRDWRPWYREGQQMAREANIYLQRYCGCIYSEAEREGIRFE